MKQYNKLCKAIQTFKSSTIAVAYIFLGQHLASFGVPSKCLADHSPRFMSKNCVCMHYTHGEQQYYHKASPITYWSDKTVQRQSDFVIAPFCIRVGNGVPQVLDSIIVRLHHLSAQVYHGTPSTLLLTKTLRKRARDKPKSLGLRTEDDIVFSIFAILWLITRVTNRFKRQKRIWNCGNCFTTKTSSKLSASPQFSNWWIRSTRQVSAIVLGCM